MVYKQTYNWGASSCLILWRFNGKTLGIHHLLVNSWGLSIVFSAYAIYPKKNKHPQTKHLETIV